MQQLLMPHYSCQSLCHNYGFNRHSWIILALRGMAKFVGRLQIYTACIFHEKTKHVYHFLLRIFEANFVSIFPTACVYVQLTGSLYRNYLWSNIITATINQNWCKRAVDVLTQKLSKPALEAGGVGKVHVGTNCSFGLQHQRLSRPTCKKFQSKTRWILHAFDRPLSAGDKTAHWEGVLKKPAPYLLSGRQPPLVHPPLSKRHCKGCKILFFPLAHRHTARASSHGRRKKSLQFPMNIWSNNARRRHADIAVILF